MTDVGSFLIGGFAPATSRKDVGAEHLTNSQRGAAWQKEVERAQLTSWFKPSGVVAPVISRGGSAEDAPPRSPTPETAASEKNVMQSGDRDAGTASVRSSRRNALQFVIQQGFRAPSNIYGVPLFASVDARVLEDSGASRSDGPSSMSTASPYKDPLLNLSSAHQMQKIGEASTEASSTSPSRLVTQQEQGATPTSLRVHMESRGREVSIWVAVPGSETQALAELPKVLNDIQKWLAANGKAIQRIYCNGALLWQGDSPVSQAEEMPERNTVSIGDQHAAAHLTAYGAHQSPTFSWEVSRGS